MKKLILSLTIVFASVTMGLAGSYCFIDYGSSNCPPGETLIDWCYSFNGDGSNPSFCKNLGCYAESEYENYDSCCIE